MLLIVVAEAGFLQLKSCKMVEAPAQSSASWRQGIGRDHPEAGTFSEAVYKAVNGGGQFDVIHASGSADVIVDLMGWFS